MYRFQNANSKGFPFKYRAKINICSLRVTSETETQVQILVAPARCPRLQENFNQNIPSLSIPLPRCQVSTLSTRKMSRQNEHPPYEVRSCDVTVNIIIRYRSLWCQKYVEMSIIFTQSNFRIFSRAWIDHSGSYQNIGVISIKVSLYRSRWFNL